MSIALFKEHIMAIVPRDLSIDFSNLRSKQSRDRAFVTFMNKTDQRVDLVWVDFEGRFVHFRTLGPGEFVDANTFTNHPWIARDSSTLDQLLVGGEYLYKANPWVDAPCTVFRNGGFALYKPVRQVIPITFPLLSLREISIRCVIKNLKHPKDAFSLEDIPRCLQKEIRDDMEWIEANRYGRLVIKNRGE